MSKMISYLPLLLPFAFPLLYYGGHAVSERMAASGLVLLCLGMSGPVIRRLLRGK